MHVSWSGINEHKPKRRDIDRFIKPYDVWRYQPRTVFLGSSRILQAIDPSLLDGTRFAPAYTAGLATKRLERLYEPERRLLYWSVFRPGVLVGAKAAPSTSWCGSSRTDRPVTSLNSWLRARVYVPSEFGFAPMSAVMPP